MFTRTEIPLIGVVVFQNPRKLSNVNEHLERFILQQVQDERREDRTCVGII